MRMFSTPWTPSGVLHNDSADCLLPTNLVSTCVLHARVKLTSVIVRTAAEHAAGQGTRFQGTWMEHGTQPGGGSQVSDTWHGSRVSDTWHGSRVSDTWHGSRVSDTWHGSRDRGTWHGSRVSDTWHGSRDRGTWHGLRDRGIWHGSRVRGHMTWFTGQRHMTRFTGQRHRTRFTGQQHMTWFTGQGHMTRFTGQRHMTWFTGQGHMTWFTGQTITGSGWKHCSQNCADTSLSHSKPSTVCSFSFAFAGTCCGIYKAQDCGLHSIPSGRSARAAHKEKHAGEFISPSASVLRDSNTSHQHPALHVTKAPTAPAQFQPRGAHSRHHSPNDVTTLVNCSEHSEQATTNHPWIVIYPTSLAEVCQSLKAYHFCAHSP